MRIVRIDVERVSLGLRTPYTIAYETVSDAVNVFVRIVTDGPHVGFGCAAPDAAVTGETVEACEVALVAAAAQAPGGDALRRTRVLADLDACFEGCPSARAAIDMALFDLLGKACGQPLWRLLGGHRTSMATSITIGIGDIADTLDEARKWLAQGFTAIKLKGGSDVERDVAAVRRVRELVGSAVALRFDANQGYTEKQAVAFLAAVHGADLQLLEQPTKVGRTRALRNITAHAPMPVMADESLLDLADAFRLARGELVDMINIKLMKVGGLEPALQVNAVARAAGLEAMVGCMDESALGIAAGLHFALARPNVQFADLDGHFDLVWDPAADAVILDRGVLHPADGPGLGLTRVACFD